MPKWERVNHNERVIKKWTINSTNLKASQNNWYLCSKKIEYRGETVFDEHAFFSYDGDLTDSFTDSLHMLDNRDAINFIIEIQFFLFYRLMCRSGWRKMYLMLGDSWHHCLIPVIRVCSLGVEASRCCHVELNCIKFDYSATAHDSWLKLRT